MIFSPEIFIRAHQDISNRYYNYSYNRYVKKAACSRCEEELGELERFPDFLNEFVFVEKEKRRYRFCPYCGHKFKKEGVSNAGRKNFKK